MKIYLVRNEWSNESACQVEMESLKAFTTYEKAKEYFESEKERIKSFDLGYDEIEDSKDYYCESINGEYLYNHELVEIREMECE